MTVDAWAAVGSLDGLVHFQTNLVASKLAGKRGWAMGMASLANPSLVAWR